MTSQKTDNYIRACMKTWLLCESCILAEKTSADPREELIEKCRSCASSCFTVVCKLISSSDTTPEAVLLCMINCRECNDECQKFISNDILFCGEICMFCAETLRSLLLPANLN